MHATSCCMFLTSSRRAVDLSSRATPWVRRSICALLADASFLTLASSSATAVWDSARARLVDSAVFLADSISFLRLSITILKLCWSSLVSGLFHNHWKSMLKKSDLEDEKGRIGSLPCWDHQTSVALRATFVGVQQVSFGKSCTVDLVYEADSFHAVETLDWNRASFLTGFVASQRFDAKVLL